MLLACGVNAADFARYRRTSMVVIVTINGTPFFQRFRDDYSADDARWVSKFVLSVIMRWQNVGLNPRVPEWCETGCDHYFEDKVESEKD